MMGLATDVRERLTALAESDDVPLMEAIRLIYGMRFGEGSPHVIRRDIADLLAATKDPT